MPRSGQRRILEELRRGCGSGIAALRRRVPDCPRNALARIVGEWEKRRRRRTRRRLCRLLWNVPGAVWAMDGTMLGGGRRLLVVADLGAKATIACRPIGQESATETIACLAALIACHGAPLVLKVDNGPGFVAAGFRRLCDHYGIVLLYSPVRRPQFNGAIEARVRWAKVAIRASAAAHNRGSHVLQEDLDAAVHGTGRVAALLPGLRAAFRRTLALALRAARHNPGLASCAKRRHAQRASLRRVAAQRALEECHILTIRRPEFRQWLPPREWG